MAEAKEEISDGKIREALKLLEAEQKESELRKTGLRAYLNVKEHNRELEKEKAKLQEESASLKAEIKADTEAHAKQKQERQAIWEEEDMARQKAKKAVVETDQKEIAGLKASLGKLKTQVAEAEKDATERLAAINESIQQKTAETEKVLKDLDAQIQERREKIAVLDEEFRSLAQKHGLGVAERLNPSNDPH